MEQRTYFKALASLGPGCAFVSLAEKLCKQVFWKGYHFGDEKLQESEEERSVKLLRAEFVDQLFKMKGEFKKSE